MPEMPDRAGATLSQPAPRLAVSPGRAGLVYIPRQRSVARTIPPSISAAWRRLCTKVELRARVALLVFFPIQWKPVGRPGVARRLRRARSRKHRFTADSSHSMTNSAQPTARTRRSASTLVVGSESQARSLAALKLLPARRAARPSTRSPRRRIHPGGGQTNPRIGAKSKPCGVAAALNAHLGAASADDRRVVISNPPC